MIVNNEDYYYLPGVAKAIKTILGRDDLKKYDVPEVLVGLGYDYDTNTIPYQEHGKMISLYRKSSIPELLNMPGNKYKANQLIAKINGRNKGMNVFVSQANVGRRRPNRKAFVTESFNGDINMITEAQFVGSLENVKIKRIIKVYVETGTDDGFVIYDGMCYYNVKGGVATLKVDQNTINLMNKLVKGLKTSYDKYNMDHEIKASNGKIIIDVDKRGKMFNVDVREWMERHGFKYDYKESFDTRLVFVVKNPVPCEDVDESMYDDITTDVLSCSRQLDTATIIKNLGRIYRHIIDKDVVFGIGSIGEIKGGCCPPGLVAIGRLKSEYPRDNDLLSLKFDERLGEQRIIGLGLLPGEYKAECKGKPCTILIWRKTSGFFNPGVAFYDDDRDVAEEIIERQKRA